MNICALYSNSIYTSLFKEVITLLEYLDRAYMYNYCTWTFMLSVFKHAAGWHPLKQLAEWYNRVIWLLAIFILLVVPNPLVVCDIGYFPIMIIAHILV